MQADFEMPVYTSVDVELSLQHKNWCVCHFYWLFKLLNRPSFIKDKCQHPYACIHWSFSCIGKPFQIPLIYSLWLWSIAVRTRSSPVVSMGFVLLVYAILCNFCPVSLHHTLGCLLSFTQEFSILSDVSFPVTSLIHFWTLGQINILYLIHVY